MHEECIVWRFEIAVFSVTGLCNPNGQHRWFGLQSSYGLCRQTQNTPPKHSLPCMYSTRLYGVITQTTLWILTTVSTSNPVPKIIKNWNVDGNITLGKLNYSWAVYFLHTIYYQILISTSCVHCFILRLKKLRNETILNINTHFMIRTTYVEFQTSATIIPQGNITSDRE